MNTRKNILLVITLLITVLLITIGLSYAYFTANLTGGESSTTITVTGGTMNITYNGGATINVANIIPSDNPATTKTFTIRGNNTTDVEMKYKVSLVIDSNTFSEEALKYKLICTNTDNNGVVIPNIDTLTNIGTGAKTITIGVGNFEVPTGGNKVHTYNLEIYFPNQNYNQNIDQEKEIKAHVLIENYISTKLSNYITGLAEDSIDTGVYNENGYRYEGLNPNNYVTFNNETWRIIGVFDDATHGKTGETLVKIIRNDSIGDYAWDTGNVNNWNTSSLKTYLNGDYYNNLTQSSKSLIENITWKLGGHSSYNSITSNFYTAERGTTVYSGRPTSGEGYIGLMYPSDYGYASLSTSCARTTNLYNYKTSGCYNQNWLFKSVNQWTLTSRSDSSYYIFNVYYYGNLDDISASGGNSVRPVLYLKSNTTKESGDGTSGNPYIIGE